MLFILLHILLPGAWCFGEVKLSSPVAVRTGDLLQLDCSYDLQGAALYSVKFYQGDEEFYRFVPKESPPFRVFPRPNLQVEITESNRTRVTVRVSDKDLTGVYKCEVSTDAPLFYTTIRSTHIVITVEPESGPEISLEKVKFTLGERVKANCTSRPAFPAANLTFFINGRKVERREETRLRWYQKSEEGGLESSRLELETVYPGGTLELSCTAAQYRLYSRTARVLLMEETPLLAQVLGATSSAPGPISCVSQSDSLIFLRIMLIVLSLITAGWRR